MLAVRRPQKAGAEPGKGNPVRREKSCTSEHFPKLRVEEGRADERYEDEVGVAAVGEVEPMAEGSPGTLRPRQG